MMLASSHWDKGSDWSWWSVGRWISSRLFSSTQRAAFTKEPYLPWQPTGVDISPRHNTTSKSTAGEDLVDVMARGYRECDGTGRLALAYQAATDMVGRPQTTEQVFQYAAGHNTGSTGSRIRWLHLDNAWCWGLVCITTAEQPRWRPDADTLLGATPLFLLGPAANHQWAFRRGGVSHTINARWTITEHSPTCHRRCCRVSRIVIACWTINKAVIVVLG